MTTATIETKLPTVDLRKYNGCLTVTNPATGNHRTFRIKAVMKGKLAGRRIIQLLTGPDNTSNYNGFGFVNDDGTISVWKKFVGDTVGGLKDVTVYEQLADIVQHADWFAQERGLRYQFSVRCRRCNRELTDPESIECGIGPVCREIH